MTSGTYVGKFVAAAVGTSTKPITLTGPRTAVLTTGSNTSGYGLHVTGSHWRLTGFSVSIAQKGIVLDRSSNTVIDGVDVGKIGQEAIHVRKNSVDVIIRNSRVHDTGLSTASYGEGIYVGTAVSNWSSIMGSSSTPDRSDRVLIENNVIVNTTAEGIDIKEGTTGGIVRGNTFTHSGYSGANYADSWVDVKGNGYLLESNSGSGTLLDAFQVHSVVTGWGGGNVFRSNAVTGGVPGYEVRISSSAPGNIVSCKSSNAQLGLTNVSCT
ncbi:MAG TPA: right-handed parallel beta-helix repeat-containing protein [Pseudolysinimonas sp.]|nr:right-handed parallel beta-helix repeat-containing protein [Pseudolysinimonas sp.]